MKHTVSKATALANTATPEEAIEEAERHTGGKVDWLGLESTLRAILRAGRTYDQDEALQLINRALGAFTGRGEEL